IVELVDLRERRKYSDDQNARAAQPGCRRQVADEGDVGASPAARKVARESTRKSHRVVCPVSAWRPQIRGDPKSNFGLSTRIDYAQNRILPRRGNQTDSTLDSADETAAARIIGVLAQEFDSSWDEQRQRVADTGADDIAQTPHCFVEQSGFGDGSRV